MVIGTPAFQNGDFCMECSQSFKTRTLVGVNTNFLKLVKSALFPLFAVRIETDKCRRYY